MDQEGVRTYLIETVDGCWIELNIQILAHPEDLDIAAIPLYASDYVRKSCNISKDQAQHMAQLKKLLPLKQILLSWHKRLNHLPNKNMFQLVYQGILPSEFAQLKSDSPLCNYCIYGQPHWKACRTHGKNLAIRQETDNTPGNGTSTYQLVSGQRGLITQIGDHLNAARIWAANVFIYHCTDLIYVHLMQSATQEKTLNTKAAYENFANNHGIKMCWYYVENGRYYEKTIQKAVADAGQWINHLLQRWCASSKRNCRSAH